MRPLEVAALGPPEKQGAASMDEHGRLRVASVRALPKAAPAPQWSTIAEGFVTTFRASSEGSRGLRVALDVGRLASPLEIRAQGTDGRIESMQVNPGHEHEVWTPWTEGSSQVIELFSPAGAPLPAPTVTSVLHFDVSPLEKAASTCTVPAACSTGDSNLDAAIAERAKSSVRITFVDNGSGFLCSATLMNTDRFPIGYLLTANHCVSTAASASSVSTFWFYEPLSCTDPSLAPGMVQLSSGTRIGFTNYNADSTLLQMNDTPPPGAVYSGWNAARLSVGDSIVSLSHPKGDTTRLALGTITSSGYRITNLAQDEYGVGYSRGIIEGGSSGSGLFTLSGGSLQLRGILTGTTIRNGSGLSCTNLNEEGLYGRFEIFYPEILPYVTGTGVAPADDTPNRVVDYVGVPAEAALNDRTVALDRRFEFVGDVDVFRFTLTAGATVTLGTQGGLDTVGTLLDANGKGIVSNDDVASGNLNFGMTRDLAAGTYYVMVAPWEPNGTGAYRMVMSATTPAVNTSDTNYSDLWWSAESGWGLDFSHQGNIIFATLYSYDTNGTPMWLFMSNGEKQPDGSFFGTLYRSTGVPFSAPTWGPNTPTIVGTMRVTFASPSTATLTYTVNGTLVNKSIRRYQFSTPITTCTWTNGDRTASSNYQDLWWNPAESGWGLTIAQQGSTLFGLLYVYDSNGQALWLSMSNGTLIAPRTYSGELYIARGPAFNASPWGSVSLRSVGMMTLAFNDGETGTLTYTVDGVQVVKSIRRTVLANPKPLCSAS
jgi:lysyl endopeptidase